MTESHIDKEFPMTAQDFLRIKNQAYEITGINLTEQKKNMIYGRLSRRIRSLKLGSFAEYCSLIEDTHSVEQHEFINAITTNLTSFFRENHHFDYLTATVFPELIRKNHSSRRIRIWSAGCSTGEEPYSIAMCIAEKLPKAAWDIKVLATDLDTNVVAHGKAAIYQKDRVSGLDDKRLKTWFQRSTDGRYRVKASIQELITFKQLNLLHPWPMKGPFDVIFCRNVVIYFDKPTQKKLFDRYADILAPGGYLFIGHSENLHKLTERFESVGRTIYRKLF